MGRASLFTSVEIISQSDSSTEAISNTECGCTPGPAAVAQLALLPSISLVMLPKCPLGLAAWFGIFGVAANPWFRAEWGMPPAIVFLTFTAGLLASCAWQNRDLRALVVSFVGAPAVVGGYDLVEYARITLCGPQSADSCLSLERLAKTSFKANRPHSALRARATRICPEENYCECDRRRACENKIS